jgi:outer membrane lipoprotein carrier protein
LEVSLRRSILAALVGVGFLAAATHQETFNAVISRYAGISSLTASFEERICSKKDDSCQILKGMFTFASPDKFRVDVTVPMQQLVLSDGKVTWIYLPTANQAIKTNPGPEQELFLFVERLQNYSKQYTVKLKPGKEHLEAHFTAKPDAKVFFSSFVMLIDTSENDLAGVKIEQADNEIFFLIDDVQRNAAVADTKFSFSPPDGTTVIENTGTGYQ